MDAPAQIIALQEELARVKKKVFELRHWHGDTRHCLAEVDGECGTCAVLDCPHDCFLHYHHDGCPECVGPDNHHRDPYCEVVSNPEVQMPPASYSDADYPFRNLRP